MSIEIVPCLQATVDVAELAKQDKTFDLDFIKCAGFDVKYLPRVMIFAFEESREDGSKFVNYYAQLEGFGERQHILGIGYPPNCITPAFDENTVRDLVESGINWEEMYRMYGAEIERMVRFVNGRKAKSKRNPNH